MALVQRESGHYLLMFRKIVRKVILKRFWQGIFDANLSQDNTRNTHTVFRRIGQKELLFQQERRILGKPFHERDAVQKKIAQLIIARLNCLGIFHPVRNRFFVIYFFCNPLYSSSSRISVANCPHVCAMYNTVREGL